MGPADRGRRADLPRPARDRRRDAPSTPEERLIAGLQPVREAIRARGPSLFRVAIDARPLPRLDALARFARDHGVQTVARLRAAELDALAGPGQHQGTLAWAPPLALADAEQLLERPSLLALALDQIQDPQNFGAIVRSAVAIGSAPIVWPEHASAPLSTATFRASAGAIEHATLCRVGSLVGWLDAARARGVQVIGLDAHAEDELADCALWRPTVLVIGNEHEGLRRSVRRACSQVASIVRQGAIDSLNASAAAAVALYAVSQSRSRSST